MRWLHNCSEDHRGMTVGNVLSVTQFCIATRVLCFGFFLEGGRL